MRYFVTVFLCCVLAFAATFSGPAFSQRVRNGCDQADSTAATLDCLNRQTQREQDKLNSTFKTVIDGQADDSRAPLSDAQKQWIMYRDAECKWEASLSTAPALTRVYELSCIKDMTAGREALLEGVYNREKEKTPREFGSQPRWMNVVANDNPDIFWRYGDWQSADIDCDDENEEIMTGIAVAHVRDAVVVDDKAVKEQAHQQIDIIVAIAENPVTGRPKVRLVRLPVTDKDAADGQPHVCRPAVKVDIAEEAVPVKATPISQEGESPDGKTGAAEAKSCTRHITVSDDVCPPVSFSWDGKDYIVKAAKAVSEGL